MPSRSAWRLASAFESSQTSPKVIGSAPKARIVAAFSGGALFGR